MPMRTDSEGIHVSFENSTFETNRTAKTDEQWGHIFILLHTISITMRDTEAKGKFGIIAVISWTQPCTLAVYVWSLAVWVHIDTANTQRTHSSSTLQTSDPSVTAAEQSAPSSSLPCPDILSVAICPPQMKIKRKTRAGLISQHWTNWKSLAQMAG